MVGLLAAIRLAVLLVEAEDRLARDKPEECWRLLEKAAALLDGTWPANDVPGHVNLQVGVAALNVGRFQLARECAAAAERSFRENETKLPAEDAAYLIYYAVMISRMARTKLGESLPSASQFYPEMTEAEVRRVHSRWRTKFPLVQVPPTDVP